ncbi:hypothetical protein CLOM_g5563 [Closterium sp. NIES-68]|nr:hypothetical protein CLOM_g5563 [Closterium sp. NIES-68]GJP61570.1 hypothetical protein CLOP_g18714 [Closterium sp. NIES-67]
MFHPTRGGVRGGKDQFKWDDVKSDKFRENFLGHSVMAPVGRWQKGKDLQWYARKPGDKAAAQAAAEEQLKLEKQRIKEEEEAAMNEMLGIAPVRRKGPKLGETRGMEKGEVEELFRRGQSGEVLTQEYASGERIEGLGFAPAPGHEERVARMKKQLEEKIAAQGAGAVNSEDKVTGSSTRAAATGQGGGNGDESEKEENMRGKGGEEAGFARGGVGEGGKRRKGSKKGEKEGSKRRKKGRHASSSSSSSSDSDSDSESESGSDSGSDGSEEGGEGARRKAGAAADGATVEGDRKKGRRAKQRDERRRVREAEREGKVRVSKKRQRRYAREEKLARKKARREERRRAEKELAATAGKSDGYRDEKHREGGGGDSRKRENSRVDEGDRELGQVRGVKGGAGRSFEAMFSMGGLEADAAKLRKIREQAQDKDARLHERREYKRLAKEEKRRFQGRD